MSPSIAQGGVARTFEVERDGVLHVRAVAPGASIEVVSCERQPQVLSASARSGITLDERAPIAAGRYAIWFTGTILEGDQSELEAELSVVIE